MHPRGKRAHLLSILKVSQYICFTHTHVSRCVEPTEKADFTPSLLSCAHGMYCCGAWMLLCAHPRVVVLRQRRRAPRRRRRGARRESSKTRRVSVVVLRTFYEQHSRVSHFQRDMSRVFHVLEDSSCAHGMCSNFRGGCWTLRTATPPLRGGCYASAQQTRPPGGSLRAATQPLKGGCCVSVQQPRLLDAAPRCCRESPRNVCAHQYRRRNCVTLPAPRTAPHTMTTFFTPVHVGARTNFRPAQDSKLTSERIHSCSLN